jgi:hypothetical protein
MSGEDSDLLAIAVPNAVRVAGGITIGAGACAIVNGLQVLLFLMGPGMLKVVGAVALVLGGACIVTGWGVVRARLSAAVAALVTTSVTALGGAAWIVFALVHGMVSLTALALLSLSAVSIFVVALSLKDIQRIDAARLRLRAQGLDGGF